MHWLVLLEIRLISMLQHLYLSVNKASTEHQQSIKDSGQWIMYNPREVLWCLPMIKVLATNMGNMVSVDVVTHKNERQQSINRGSTEWQRFRVLHVI
jgi:hypothetical protein